MTNKIRIADALNSHFEEVQINYKVGLKQNVIMKNVKGPKKNR